MRNLGLIWVGNVQDKQTYLQVATKQGYSIKATQKKETILPEFVDVLMCGRMFAVTVLKDSIKGQVLFKEIDRD